MLLLRILKKHSLPLLLPLLSFGLLYWIWGTKPKYQGYAPDQPIAFSHALHAGELQMDCQFCHTSVERSAQASIPDTATCMKCHQEVASDSKDIQYLIALYKQGIPIRWHKVHDLPDHARFSHKVHIAKGLDCSACHGPVAKMDKVEVHSAFHMGWCVNCHRNYAKEQEKLSGEGTNVGMGLTECSTCHY